MSTCGSVTQSSVGHTNCDLEDHARNHDQYPRSSPLEDFSGIGGLTAALGLRQQGHEVTLFERSHLAKETGAAIHLAPNCHGILRRFGVFPETFGANPVNGVTEYDAAGKLKFDNDLSKALRIWQHPWVLSHRVQLHEELKKLAVSSEGLGTPAVLQTSSQVVDVDPSTATVKLADGTSISGDLVLGADGVSSITRQIVVGPGVKPYGSGKSAFRFMIPCERIGKNPITKEFLDRQGYLTMWMGDDRRLIMYPCSNNTVMNFVGIHPSEISAAASKGDGWGQGGSKELLLDVYKGFEQRVRSLLEFVDSSELKVWTLLDMERIPSWHRERLVLLGDAAHPFLPRGIAIEDAASLCALLPRGTRRDDIADRLPLYEKLRDHRAHKVQEFTRQAGMDLNDENRGDFNIMEFMGYNFSHDEWHNSTRALKELLWSRNGGVYWRSPVSFGPMPSPRQDHYGRPIPSQDSRFTTYKLRFKTSATHLKTLLPTPAFSFYQPGTIAEASFQCTELKDLKWLGGGGYNFFGLWIHGVQYEKKDGSKLRGSFLAVLLESLTDPIVTGREELGMPKIYCDIDVEKQDSTASIRCSWRGATFVEMALNEEGLLVYRYVPAVGNPGVADAAYPVFLQNGLANNPPEVDKVTVGSGGGLVFTEGNWENLPTLHHIAAGFSEIPVYDIVESKVEEGHGVDDLAHARRVE
ncbi:hypothetical protein B0J15DRAFT_535498 [Fusarium solani]|uniref:FAD-binding domain-containing protein n=1 Tax=Fusarium solani TaxID=169388 RepID=A0A9P9HKS3_FUSSL|nr:uncharacterized protein B0J15DRAFT_535498 [Fusarium solani]KAH7258472.1 hypothetical protein B0J15DRAFT_535498 [Fusarium solani]